MTNKRCTVSWKKSLLWATLSATIYGLIAFVLLHAMGDRLQTDATQSAGVLALSARVEALEVRPPAPAPAARPVPRQRASQPAVTRAEPAQRPGLDWEPITDFDTAAAAAAASVR